MILELLLDRFSTVCMLFPKNSKKGRHAFRLRHGKRIDGRTYQNRAQTDKKTLRTRTRNKVSQEMLKSQYLYRFWDQFWSKKVIKHRANTCQKKKCQKSEKRAQK